MTSVDTATLEIPVLPQAVTRRDDVEYKQGIVARLLADSESDGLLLLEPVNFRWLTGGALPHGIFGPDEIPALFVNSSQRWLLCSSVDTQRIFDEELNGLGFQVKEWPWLGSREQHLTDLCFARKVACDRPFRDCKQVGTFLEQERRRLSRFEEDQMLLLGHALAHALEATARNIGPGDSEAEVAGHLAHRLLKHGVEPLALQIAADDRARRYRRPGFTPAPIESRCLLQATGGRNGLFATASRCVAFGDVEPAVRAEFDAAARLSAHWLSMVKAGDRPALLLDAQQQLFNDSPFEHEWRLVAPGWWTGRAASEGTFTRNSSAKFTEGNTVVFRAHIGGCAVADTFVLRTTGWVSITAVDEWPIRRYSLQGVSFDRPDLLVRAKEAG